LFGDFDVFEGQFFEMWRRDLHVVPVLDMHNPDFRKAFDSWTLLGTIDYGERTVLEVQYRDHEGNIVTFAESYTESRIPSDRFNAMADMLLELKLFNLSIQYDTNMDINLKNYTGYDNTPTNIANEVFKTRMGDKAPNLYVVSKASTDKRGYRIACNEAMIQHLSWERDKGGHYTRRPKHYITANCKELIKTLPTLQRDPDSQDGLDFRNDVGIDDPYDADKMTLMGIMQPRKKVEQKLYTSEEEYMREKVFGKIVEKNLRPRRIHADQI
jgi:hypothetical protein